MMTREEEVEANIKEWGWVKKVIKVLSYFDMGLLFFHLAFFM
jgi:hypothetical protein